MRQIFLRFGRAVLTTCPPKAYLLRLGRLVLGAQGADPGVQGDADRHTNHVPDSLESLVTNALCHLGVVALLFLPGRFGHSIASCCPYRAYGRGIFISTPSFPL